MRVLENFDPVVVSQVPGREQSVKRFVAVLVFSLVSVVALLLLLKVDIITRFAGEIAARGGTVKIVNLEAGVVSRIHVANGMMVEQGAELLSLDNTKLLSQLRILDIERSELEKKIELEKLLEGAVASVPLKLIESQSIDWVRTLSGSIQPRQYLPGKSSVQAFCDQLFLMHETALRLESEYREREKELERLKQLESVRYKRFSLLREAADMASITQIELLEAEEKLVDFRQESFTAQARLETAARAKQEQRAKWIQFISESRRRWRENIVDYSSRLSIMARRIDSTRHAIDQMEIRSPLSGVVQDMEVRHVGVRLAQGVAIAHVVPVDDPIVVEGYLDNQDVAYVKDGQLARIKVEAYPYTIYGAFTGRVSFVARDSGGIAQGRQYKVLINVDTSQPNGMEHLSLLSGMNVSVEVKTGERRLIEYFYSPAADALDGAFSER